MRFSKKWRVNNVVPLVYWIGQVMLQTDRYQKGPFEPPSVFDSLIKIQLCTENVCRSPAGSGGTSVL